jgi:hypothetical protein
MKIQTQTSRNARPILGKLVLALICATALGGMAATPAFARDDHRDDHRNDHRNDGRHDRNWHGNGYGYQSQPVYVPPPVYYAPRPSPGISLFLPLNIRIR